MAKQEVERALAPAPGIRRAILDLGQFHVKSTSCSRSNITRMWRGYMVRKIYIATSVRS